MEHSRARTRQPPPSTDDPAAPFRTARSSDAAIPSSFSALRGVRYSLRPSAACRVSIRPSAAFRDSARPSVCS
eukprot:21820-Prymnesium_polylepis.1